MLNLLPVEQKKKVVAEYSRRIWTIVLLGVIVVTIVSGIFLLPVYLMANGTYTQVAREKETLERQIAESQKNSSEESVKNIYEIIGILDQYNVPISSTALIQASVLDKPSGVNIGHIVYTPSKDSPATLDVYGKAATRAALVSYSDNLKLDGNFSSVFIPISSFTKERDVTFSVKLLATTTPVQ